MSIAEKITVVYESPIGDFRVVQRSDTTYYYPQALEPGVLNPRTREWHYLYIGDKSKEDNRISEASVAWAMCYEQCINGTVHVTSEEVLEGWEVV